MELVGYGIVLTALTFEDIELVRTWRNQDFVRNQMEFTNIISLKEQERWFKRINEEKSYYFIISTEKKPIGLVHLNQLNLALQSAHVGIFIGEASYIGTGISLKVSLLIFRFAFESLALKTLHAKINNKNEAVIAYNRFLGFKQTQAGVDFSIWSLTSEDFEHSKNQIKRLL